MSAGGDAAVQAVNLNDFLREGYEYIVDGSKFRTVTLLINGDASEGWQFFAHEFKEGYDTILRRPIDNHIGTAEYVRVFISDDGGAATFAQGVVIQNDNNYKGRGMDRFDALTIR